MSLLFSSRLFDFDNSTSANDIIETNDGNYIIVGRIYDPDGDMGFSMKITPMGAIIWEQKYSSVFPILLKSVTKLSDGTYVATGSYFYSMYAGDEYVYAVNFDDNGNLIWERAYGQVGIQSDGYSVVSTNDGGFIIAGLSNEDSANTWVLKFDSTGNIEWNKKYDIGVAFSIIQTKDKGYALVGRTSSNPSSLESSPFILKIDPNGNVVWQNVYNQILIYALLNGDIIQNSCGNFVIVAKKIIMEVDKCGNIIWIDGNDNLSLTSITETPNQNYAIGGIYIVSHLEHAYLAILNKNAFSYCHNYEKIIWDNVDIEYDSGFNSIIYNKAGYLVGCGYLSGNDNKLVSFFSIFDPYNDVL